MAITSLAFVLFAFVVVVAFHLATSAAYRLLVLAVANVAFIASQASTVLALMPLLAFVAFGYLGMHWVRRGPRWALPVMLVATIAIFIALKRFSLLDGLPELPFPYLTLGLSYLLFRIIHLLVDARAGELPEAIGPLRYFNYSCNFLSLVSGPIQRYQDFAAGDAAPAAADEHHVFHAFSRIATGFVKVAVVSAVFNHLFNQFSPALLATDGLAGAQAVSRYMAVAVIYALYLYANFSGYMDIVIGIGMLLGQRLPENFNYPFAARSFLEFWTRWHITLSEWFRTYLFNPLLKALATRFPAASLAPWLGVIAFFATFLVMGLWHGTTAVFVAYGLLLGFGAATNKLWQVTLTRRLGKARYRAFGERPVVRALCRGATFAYFVMALTCFWVDLAQLGRLVQQLGPHGILAAFVLITVANALVMSLWDQIKETVAGSGLKLNATGDFIWRNTALAAQVLAVLMVGSFFHKAPEFVYRTF